MADEATGATAAESTAAVAAATETPPNVLAEASAAAGAQATDAKPGDGAQAEGAKAAAGDKADGGADKPIEYADFTMPEGVEVDTETLGEAKTLLADMKLPQEQAQKLVDFYAGKIKQFGTAQATNWVKLNEKWVGEFKADKEIGGDNVQSTVAAAVKAMDRFGTPGLREALAMTGAGNHPEVIRFVARVGKAIGEDSHVVAASGSAASKSAAEVFYPNQAKAGT